MGSEKSDKTWSYLTQATEKVLPLESERAKMLSLGLDAIEQPDTVPEEKGLPRVLLISADEMCEETSVDVIKETTKEDINPVILSKQPVNSNDDEIEKYSVFKAKLFTCSQIMGQLPAERISQSFPLSKVELDFCGISGINILIKENES
ncbi:uncharacterized protein TNIN_390391 [Trichonephila inaurata madagascariensis]|uniref:Uncharacterized protein n=1 Tax=Trichonephila inaurata madagascariensis TaxID=2747483 RepID=A0A8X6YJU6_9ARAC|nr:uncharacterized protein TNIN_390391 [Trichonephila inaurata madagascariensis]